MSSTTAYLPRLHPAQWQIASHPARFRVSSCGRRFGKTLEAAGECVIEGARGGRVWWIAPTYKTAEFGWRAIKKLTRQIPSTIIREVDRQVEFSGGGFIVVRSGDTPDSLRGEGLDFAVVDEAAFCKAEVWTDVLRPALSDRKGRALFLSTPNGRNWFWHIWMLGQDPDHTEWKSWRFPTAENPYIDADEIEAARGLLPERTFKQEYLAEFLDDGGAVFRNITAACTVDRRDTPEPGHTYIFGVDWARDNDFTVIAIIDTDTKQLVHLDRFNSIGWALQRGRLAALVNVWKPDLIWAEENSIGGPNIEALQAEGLPVQPFMTTAQSKGPLIESLALAFEQGGIGIINDPVLVGELQAYTFERLPSGRFAYSAPAGLHDDTVIALALAWHGATYSGLGLAFV